MTSHAQTSAQSPHNYCRHRTEIEAQCRVLLRHKCRGSPNSYVLVFSLGEKTSVTSAYALHNFQSPVGANTMFLARVKLLSTSTSRFLPHGSRRAILVIHLLNVLTFPIWSEDELDVRLHLNALWWTNATFGQVHKEIEKAATYVHIW